MQNASKIVETNQVGIHENLIATVQKHLRSRFQKPYADHSKRAFDRVAERRQQFSGYPIIFDSCCGVGDSSRALAERNPGHFVIGADKSEKRLMTERTSDLPENLIMVRTDLNDFYRMAVDAGWRFDRHYIFYPNPWPKSEHLKRRWHGAPVFPYMLALGGILELRSNWKLYLDEFCAALETAGVGGIISPFDVDRPITAFEAKYDASGQRLWQLVADLRDYKSDFPD